MQHHEVHKRIILVPRLWFMKQQIGKGGNKAGRKVNKAKFPFWSGPFWTFSCCSIWNVLYGLPSRSLLPCREARERRVLVPVRTPQRCVCASGPCSRWPRPEALVLLGSVVSGGGTLLSCGTFIAFCFWDAQWFFSFGKRIASLQRNGFNSWEEAGDQSLLYTIKYMWSIYIYVNFTIHNIYKIIDYICVKHEYGMCIYTHLYMCIHIYSHTYMHHIYI